MFEFFNRVDVVMLYFEAMWALWPKLNSVYVE